MKKASLVIILLCLLGGASYAATVGGTVTNSSTSAAVAGQKVYFYDPATAFKDSTTTNSSGVYSFLIPLSVPSYDSLVVYTKSCGTTVTYRPFYTGSNIVVNFSICVPPAYTIHGAVSLSGASMTSAGLAKVYLIRKQYDSTLMDTTLTAIDSFATAAGGGYSKTYTTNPLANLPWSATLLLKAALQPAHPSYWSYVPTYYDSSLVWNAAVALTTASFATANATNIYMRAGTYTGGSGFVGGSVLLGANKYAAVGDPLRNRILILTNSSGTPLGYTYSDTAGKFSFTNLAFGTYKIFGDSWGKLNPALTFTLTGNRATITNIIFEENSKKFEGHFANVTGIMANSLNGVSAYPNPATTYVSFTGLSNISGNKSVVLRDITGALLHSQSFSDGQRVEVNTSTLPAGIYLLQLQTDAGSASFRVVK